MLRHHFSITAVHSGSGQHDEAGDPARCPLLFDIDSDPEDDRAHRLEQQATRPTVMLPALCHQSSPDKCLLFMDTDAPSGKYVAAQHAQQPHDSWQQRTEPQVPSGPVSNMSPETDELLMDLDSEFEEHESAQLEQQHSHTPWQQPGKNEPSLGSASCHAEPSATHSLMDVDTDSHCDHPSDPEDDHQQQQQHQYQLHHGHSQQQHGHQQQQVQVQVSIAGNCIPMIFDDYEEDTDLAPGPAVPSPDCRQNQPQHAQHNAQSDEHDQLQQWNAEEEQRQLQHPGSNITAATPAATDADATHGTHAQTPPTAVPHTANAKPMRNAKSAAAKLQYDQYKCQQSREAGESRLQTNSCSLVFDLEQEEEAGSQAMAESPADEGGKALQLQGSGSGQQPHQQLPAGQQGISPRLHAQLQAAQDKCPLVFDSKSDEEDCYRSSVGTQPGHLGLDRQAMVSTAGHFANSYLNADSAGQLSNSPPGSASPELFRQSPDDAVVSGQLRQRPPAWDPESVAHRCTVQMQTGDFHAKAQCLVVCCDLPLATGRSTMSTTLVLHI